MPITLRNTKGSELTFSELDGNFTHLDARIDSTGGASYLKSVIDSSYVLSFVDSDHLAGIVDQTFVNSRLDTLQFLDSAEAIQLIDSAHVQARVGDLVDSADVVQLIDSAHVQARLGELVDSADVVSIIDSDHVQARADTVKLRTYTVATLPTGVAGQLIYVSDGDSGNPTLAMHDGSTFKRIELGTTVSG
tara:strand:- start:66 stop:638 length:573 start_codon:yes stop_codon:yes gene_type:complete